VWQEKESPSPPSQKWNQATACHHGLEPVHGCPKASNYAIHMKAEEAHDSRWWTRCVAAASAPEEREVACCSCSLRPLTSVAWDALACFSLSSASLPAPSLKFTCTGIHLSEPGSGTWLTRFQEPGTQECWHKCCAFAAHRKLCI